MHPMAGDRWPAPLPSLMVSGKGDGALTIFFFFLVSPFLFSTSFSIVYSANGQISWIFVGTEQLGRISWSQNTQSPHKTLYTPPGFSELFQKHSSHEWLLKLEIYFQPRYFLLRETISHHPAFSGSLSHWLFYLLTIGNVTCYLLHQRLTSMRAESLLLTVCPVLA